MATANGTKAHPWIKDPDSVRTFGVNWGTWLSTGDTLSTSGWTLLSGTVVIDTHTSNTTTATVKLSGGTVGEKAVLRNRITTTLGETEDRTVYVFVRQK